MSYLEQRNSDASVSDCDSVGVAIRTFRVSLGSSPNRREEEESISDTITNERKRKRKKQIH